jgi:hypothetical protein
VGVWEPLAWGFASAALVLILTGRLWNGPARSGAIHPAGRALVPVVLLAAHYGLKQRLPMVPPREALDWTLWAAVLAVFVPDLWAGGTLRRLTVWGTLLLVLCYAILRPRIGHLEPGAAAALFIGAWAFWLFASVQVKSEAPGLMEGLLIVTMGAAGCLAHSYAGAALVAGYSALCPPKPWLWPSARWAGSGRPLWGAVESVDGRSSSCPSLRPAPTFSPGQLLPHRGS